MSKLRNPEPLGDRILIKIDTDSAINNKYSFNERTGSWEEKSESGMVLKILSKDDVERLQINHTDAYVVEMGKDCWLNLGSGQPRCKVGDKIWINKYSGVAVPELGDGHMYRLISDEDAFLRWRGESLND